MFDAPELDFETSLVEAPIHGRVVMRRCRVEPVGTVLGFHGYGETCAETLAELVQLDAAETWDLVAVNWLCTGSTPGEGRVVSSVDDEKGSRANDRGQPRLRCGSCAAGTYGQDPWF